MYSSSAYTCTTAILRNTCWTAVAKRFRPRGASTRYMDAAFVLLTPEGSSLPFIQVGLLQLQSLCSLCFSRELSSCVAPIPGPWNRTLSSHKMSPRTLFTGEYCPPRHNSLVNNVHPPPSPPIFSRGGLQTSEALW